MSLTRDNLGSPLVRASDDRRLVVLCMRVRRALRLWQAHTNQRDNRTRVRYYIERGCISRIYSLDECVLCARGKNSVQTAQYAL